MKINRRVFLGSMLYVVSTAVIPFELKSSLKLTVFKSDASFFNAEQMTLAHDIADIMIPKTHTPGASDSHAAQILDELMVSWASLNTQQQMLSFLSEFQDRARDLHNKDYLLMTRERRLAYLVEIDQNAFEDTTSPFLIAYKRFKELIFHLHYTSKEANPEFILVPGGYKGDLTEDELQAINKRQYL
ncbi:gluconate 2-dehydrogenase subunit 3 family protein [Alteromonas macleodii]|uniref:gluconate 2-dehydrogenase subunit 3 family protein n=1 Tax=Alteromonas macleodii TaxID=28108 RepID=UPI003BF8F016